MKKNVIPMHYMRNRTLKGMHIFVFDSALQKSGMLPHAHRDDHYEFYYQMEGTCHCMVDFSEYVINGFGILPIFPGQVHWGISSENCSGLFLSLDAQFVPNEFREIFEDPMHPYKPLLPQAKEKKMLTSSFELLYEKYESLGDSNLSGNVLKYMVAGCVGIIAELYYGRTNIQEKYSSRNNEIVIRFKRLVLDGYKEMKQPVAYAERLNLSLPYLNEVVKKVTGFPVSYWIQEPILLEAKRLLSYSDLSVKEIAYELGYEDPSYFTRLFTKNTEISPIVFRNKYRVMKKGNF